MTQTLAIITVIYENYKVFDEFIISLKNQSNKNFHLFVIDVSLHKKTLSINDISNTVIITENKGYADGVNLGLAAAQHEGFNKYAVMNCDTYFKTEFVNSILGSLEKHPNSLVGGKIYYAPGYEYHKERYTKNDLGNVLWYAGGKVDWNHVVTPHTGVDEVDKGQFDEVKKVSFITGCLICFNEEVLNKIGFWDPSYFLYYEDADYSVRATKKNVPLYYDPSIVMWHKVSSMTEGSGSKFHQKYQNKNRLKFGLKYAPLKTKIHLIKNHILGQ